MAIICRNTTEALNHLAYRLRLSRDDVVVTTVAGHHANLLPWSRAATCRYVECEPDGTFGVGINTTEQDGARLLAAVARIAAGNPPPVPYRQDPHTGDYQPCGDVAGQLPRSRAHQPPCSPG